MFLHERACQQHALANHRTDVQSVSVATNVCKIRYPVQIDQMIDLSVTHVHHRHERLTAGQHASVFEP